MASNADPLGDLWGPALEWTPELRLELRYNELVTQLMADYQPSYSAGAAEDAWRMAPGGDNDPYGGPFYTTAAGADAAAAVELARVEAARAELPGAEAAVAAARRRLEELRAELAGSHPWQRHRRERLRGQIEHADGVLDDRCHEASQLESLVEWSSVRYGDAAWIAGVLGRYERAVHAAEESAARTLGWRPGQPAEDSPPRAIGSPGRRTPAGEQVHSAHARPPAIERGSHPACLPPPADPPRHAAGGPITQM
jgi:hypothetical protein